MSAPPRHTRANLRWVLLAVGWLSLRTACGHGDLHVQIEQVNEQIQQNPREATLYLRRARLHHLHENWPAAETDFDQAEVLVPTMDAIHLGRGQMLLAANRLTEAQSELNKFLTQKPQHVTGLITRARIEHRRGQSSSAAADFLRALELSPHPEPEIYVECAQSLAGREADAKHLLEAVAVLDRGIAKLGQLPSLGLPALDLEIRLGHFEAALARIRQLSATSPRQETWLARRGDILRQAGRPSEAMDSYRAAIDAIARLSAHVRAHPATAKLMASLVGKLKTVSAPTIHDCRSAD